MTADAQGNLREPEPGCMEAKCDLALIDSARLALAEASTVADATDLRDRAAAIARYLKRKHGATEAAHYANEIRLRAERRIGEMLREQGELRGGPTSRAGQLASRRLTQAVLPLEAHR